MRINLLQFALFLTLLGVLFIILTTSTFPFKNTILSSIYPKPDSFASRKLETLPVDLKIEIDGQTFDGFVNVPLLAKTYKLKWETHGGPQSCIGGVWGTSNEDLSFKGSKDPEGGIFETSILDKTGPYVFTIVCQDENGILGGDSVTINVGAKGGALDPFLSGLQVQINGTVVDYNKVSNVMVGDLAKIKWSVSNILTPYSVCIASGSWPSVYKNISGIIVAEEFTFTERKSYIYTIFCSNESGAIQKSFRFIAK